MRLKRKFKIIFTLTPIMLAGVIFSILFILQPEQPIEKIKASRQAISEAESNGAKFFASKELSNAIKFRSELLTEWKKQNQTPFYKRNFDRVISLANKSINEANKAVKLSITGKKELSKNIQERTEVASDLLSKFEEKYYQLPFPNAIRKNFTQGKLLFLEALSAAQRGDSQLAYTNINQSHNILQKLQTEAETYLKIYFESFPKWERWVKETINWSKQNNDYAIIVDKIAQTCTLYKNGKVNRVFSIEMGPNWIGHKRMQGDKATPEGRYHVTKKRERNQTIFYKILHINYPNAEDKESFDRAIRNGTLPPDTCIGNLLAIHGEGGKGFHWTEGCVALINSEMDILYNAAKVGTPVTIVGSTQPFSKIFD